MHNILAIALSLGFAAASLAQEARPFATFDAASLPILNDPHDLVIGPDGRLYVADKFAHSIAVLDPETLELVEVLAEGQLPGVHDISFGPAGQVAVAVTGANAVLLYDDVAGLGSGPAALIQASRTEGVLWHSNGRVYVMASGVGQIGAFEDGAMVAVNGPHPGAHDVAEGPDGSVWVADNAARRLVRYSPDLVRLQTLDHPKFGFRGPRYLDVLPTGLLVVADQDAHRMLLIDPEGPDGGTLLGVIGTGTPGIGPGLFDDPEGAAADGARYFFADSDNNRVVRYIVVLN